MSQRESLPRTMIVAGVLCVVCSLGVSAAAVVLKPLQEANKVLDRQRNILDATGIAFDETGNPASELSGDQVDEYFSWISPGFLDFETGQLIDESQLGVEDASKFDQENLAKLKDETKSISIADAQFNIKLPRRENKGRVYFVRREGKGPITQVVLPVRGKGLWSTLKGYLAVRSDLETIQGITFYEHAETPGLGGNVDKDWWKKQWQGKKLYDKDGNPEMGVAKGKAGSGDKYRVDGLTGATITSNGVTNLVRFWASDDGYRQFLNSVDLNAVRNELESGTSGSTSQSDNDENAPGTDQGAEEQETNQDADQPGKQ